MKSKTISFLLSALLALGGVPALAGVVFEVETTDHDSSPPTSEEGSVMADGHNLKMAIASGARHSSGDMIFRGDRREMVVVDHDDKSYMVIDEEAMGQLAGQVAGAMDAVQEALKNVPEEQRAAVEKMMRERMPQAQPHRPRSSLRKTSEHGEKNGYPCVKYEVWRDGNKARELWVTDWGNIDGGHEMRGAWLAMAGFMEELFDTVQDSMPPEMRGALGDDILGHMKEIDGFPVVTREFEGDGSLESESTLRSSRRQTLDPAEFEPPAGYKRRTMLGRG